MNIRVETYKARACRSLKFVESWLASQRIQLILANVNNDTKVEFKVYVP